MNAIELISQDLFDKVRSRFSNLQMGDENGGVTLDPTEARFFDFDFVLEGNDLGRVSISINDLGTLKVFYSQGITEGQDSVTQGYWFDFLREMRGFAKRRMLRFDTRDITKGNLEKQDFQYLAVNGSKEPNMTESSMYGSSKSSYRPLEKTMLIIRHNHQVGEDRGARSRSNNINAIFIQNEAGERFKYPTNHLAGARAMQRHVANGGMPYDTAGSAIIQMSEQIKQLSTFKRQVGNVEQLTQEAVGIVDRVGSKLQSLRSTVESISKQGHYQEWREGVESAEANAFSDIDETTIEDYKSKFTVSSFKEDLAQFFPLVYSIMQEAGDLDLEDYVGEAKEDDVCPVCDADPCECEKEEKVDEMAEFENWADTIAMERFEDEVEEAVKGQDVSDKSWLKSAGKKPSVGSKIKDAAKGIKAFAKGDREAEKKLDTYEAFYMGAEDLPEWTRDALHRVSRGEVKDPAELYSELVTDLGIDDNKASRIAQMTFTKGGGIDITAQHRVAPPDDGMGNIPGSSADGEEDDDSFLNRLRGQAKSGSIKPGVDTGGVDEETDEEGFKNYSAREVAETILSHYDRETGKFPLGETGVITKIGKEYGEHAKTLADALIKRLQSKSESQDQMEAISRLAGLPVINEGIFDKLTAYKNKLTQMFSPEEKQQLADVAKQATGGDMTLSLANAKKVGAALLGANEDMRGLGDLVAKVKGVAQMLGFIGGGLAMASAATGPLAVTLGAIVLALSVGSAVKDLAKPKDATWEEGMFGFGMPKTKVNGTTLMVQGDQKAGQKVMAALQKANPKLAAQGKHYGTTGMDGPQYLGIQFASPQLAQQAAQALGSMAETASQTDLDDIEDQDREHEIGNDYDEVDEDDKQMESIRKLAGLKVNETGEKGSWKKETPWKKATKKDPRGIVTNLSDKARREAEKKSKE